MKIWLFPREFVPLHSLNGNRWFDPLAQLVEQYTFNVWVLGSSPKRITQKSLQDAQHPQRLFLCLVRGIGRLASGGLWGEDA